MRTRTISSGVVRWLIALVMFCGQGGLLPYVGRAYAQSTAGPSEAELQQAAEELEKLFDGLEAAAAEIPRDTFDPGAIIEMVGNDPIELFEWVRDKTYLVPYRGVLKGPTGVLMDRLGNSLDRSLLLYELLGLPGHEVRLVRAQLSPEQARQLMDNARAIPHAGALPRATESEADLYDSLNRYAVEFGLDQELLLQQLDLAREERQSLADEIAQRVEEQTAFIAEAVGLPEGDPEAELRAAQLESLQDHWWVQLSDGTTWVDLDPTLPESLPGQMLSAATETFQPGELGELDEELLHGVRIRVVMECLEEGNLTETVALESPFLIPAELYGERIALRHIPATWPKDLDLSQEDDPAEHFRSVVLEQRQWFPLLSVGSTQLADKNYTDSCEFGDATQASTGVIGLGQGVGNMFGGGIGGSEEQAPQLTAEWIEYEIQVPGQPDETVRRRVFDLVGPASRVEGTVQTIELSEVQVLERGLALMSETEILPQTSHLSQHFVEHLVSVRLLSNREVLLDLVRGTSMANVTTINDHMTKMVQLPSPSYGLALARSTWSNTNGATYIDRPNILSYHRGAKQNSQKELVSTQRFDIVANGVAVSPGSAISPFLLRLEQGVLDTNAEALLLAGLGAVANTAEMHATSRNQRARWEVLRAPDEPSWRDDAVLSDVYALILQDLEADYVVIVPHEPDLLKSESMLSWWRIDPDSGQTLGIGSDGSGQATVEFNFGKAANTLAQSVVGLTFCSIATRVVGEPDENFPQRGTTTWTGLALCVLGFGAGLAATIFVLDGMAAAGFMVYISLLLSGVGGTAPYWGLP